jgi:hypothetical protein
MTMSMLSLKSFRLPALAAAVLLVGGQMPLSRHLQQTADEAALAAVEVLGTGGSESDARAQAQQIVAAKPGLSAEVNVSPAALTVTVKLSAGEAKKAVTSHARYLPADQPAEFSSASRQRFAVKRAPVVLGASCVENCDGNSLR